MTRRVLLAALAQVLATAAAAPAVRAQRGGGSRDPLRLGVIDASGRVRKSTVAVEEYVAQVLAGEAQPRAGAAALEALAITARTFALANRGRHRRDGYDLCNTTHCQVLRSATSATRAAARATAGRVLLDGRAPAEVFYSASCGGRTELASRVWSGAADPGFLPSQKDEPCEDDPAWTTEIGRKDLERVLRAAGLRGGRLRGLRVSDRYGSGRVERLRVDGFTPAELSGPAFRNAFGRTLGWTRLRSTAFDVDRDGDRYTFSGRGYGHGVGLCVTGAGHRAAAGDSAEKILRFYFPGLAIERY